MDILKQSCKDTAASVSKGDCSAREVAEVYLERIEKYNSSLNALLWSDPESVLSQADAVDADIKAGRPAGVLAGVPVVIKDNICYSEAPATCASKMLETYTPPYNAHVVDCLRKEGALIIGKANMDEFAMGSSNETSAFGPVVNPRCPDRVPGGSSGGSAVSVAAGLAPLSLGSDTGGSIRQPASHTGVVGMKPTYGAVSRFGLVAFGSSLDQIGSFAKNCDDLNLLLHVISGPDSRDGTYGGKGQLPGELDVPADFSGVTVGIPGEYIVEGISDEVMNVFSRCREIIESNGGKTVEVSLPHTEYGVAVYYILACAEASSNLARFDGVHYGHRSSEYDDLVSMFSNSRMEGFGDEVKRRILLGTHVLSAGYYDAYYNKALKVRALLRDDFNRAFEYCDTIMCPVAPTPAFKVGEFTDNPLQMYLSDIFTISVNLAGIPGISVPAAAEGLPVGVQFLGPHFSDSRLLQIASVYEKHRGFGVDIADMGELS